MFHAQQPNNQNKNQTILSTQQGRPPPLGQCCMNFAEQEQYRNEKCEYCDKVGHIAKIC